MISQEQKVLRLLRSTNGSTVALTAMVYVGVTRADPHISRLRKKGYTIQRVGVGYRLVDKPSLSLQT